MGFALATENIPLAGLAIGVRGVAALASDSPALARLAILTMVSTRQPWRPHRESFHHLSILFSSSAQSNQPGASGMVQSGPWTGGRGTISPVEALNHFAS